MVNLMFALNSEKLVGISGFGREVRVATRLLLIFMILCVYVTNKRRSRILMFLLIYNFTYFRVGGDSSQHHYEGGRVQGWELVC